MKFNIFWKKFIRSVYFQPLFLLLLCILGYGILAPRLGFYLDDWYIVWFEKLFGPSHFVEFFHNDRPFFAYVYMIFVPLFNGSHLGWQIFAVFTRWLSIYTFWILLNLILPERKRLTLTAAILFMVYPGFQFHWFSVMYSQVYFLLAIYILSYIMMIQAIRSPTHREIWLVGALVCQLIGIVPEEYFYGLEFARPILLWFVTNQNQQNKSVFKKTLLNWLPYLIVLIGFTSFRVLFSQSYGYQIHLLDDLHSSPVSTLANLFSNVFWYFYNTAIQVWFDLPKIFQRNLLTSSSILMVGLIVVSFVLIFFTLQKTKGENDSSSVRAEVSFLWIGIFLSLTAMIPFVVAGFPISLDFPYNRFLLALSPGIALFITGLIGLLLRTDRQQVVLISLIASLAIGSQFLAARSFMLYWQQQTDFFAQLTWRIPGLKPSTTLITDDLGFSQYYSGTSLTAPLNLIYAPENKSANISYMMLLSSGGEASAISSLAANEPISYTYRGFRFTGNTSNLVAFVQPAGACLRVLTPEDSIAVPKSGPRSEFWSQVIPLSNPEDILTETKNPATLPSDLFAQPDTNQWCYFFEKADLARQQSDWQQVIGLYQQAADKGYQPKVPAEWLPLIDAYANTNQLDKAFQATQNIKIENPDDQVMLCNTWNNLLHTSDNTDDRKEMSDFMPNINCLVNP